MLSLFTTCESVQAIFLFPDQSGVYLQCHAVYTAAALQHTQCTCSIGCTYTADTLPLAGSVCSLLSVYTAATLKLYCLHTPLRSGFQYGFENTLNMFMNDNQWLVLHYTRVMHTLRDKVYSSQLIHSFLAHNGGKKTFCWITKRLAFKKSLELTSSID